MKGYTSFIVFLLLIINGAISYENFYSIFQDLETKNYYVQKGNLDNAVAVAFYANDQNLTGWGRLVVTTNKNYDDKIQVYAAGYLEGSISPKEIWESYYNYVMTTFPGGKVPAALKTWLNNNWEWMKSQVAANPNDPYWEQVDLVMTQLQGVTDGYLEHCEKGKELNLIDQILGNADGDLEDLIPITTPNMKKLFMPAQFQYAHCSALIKPTSNGQELFSAHTTWSTYVDLLRIYKIYNFNLNSAYAVAKNVSFSSYPAYLGSVDDFYITSAGLSVIETTNGIYNTSLYKYITPQSVLSWIRVIVANRMSADGNTWTRIFSKYNSGTYNNQWIITDYKRFEQSSPLKPGTLFILEQIPGFCQIADVTSVMASQGYWPSYNIPYFPYIYDISGFPQQVKQYGDLFSYSKCPRANIFRREQVKVDSLDKMKFIMRFNEYQYDPFSDGDPGNSISSRFDLETSSPNPFGGIDSKITSSTWMKEFTTTGISGPTYYGQRVFDWSQGWSSTPHLGMPNRYDFGWHIFKNEG